MRNMLVNILIFSIIFQSNFAFAGKVQQQGIKTAAECVAAGATAATCLPLDSQIYVGSNGINDTLANAIINGQIGASAGGSTVELLSNPGFESGGATQGWTSTGGTVVTNTSGTHLFFGNKSAQWTASASAQQFKSSALAIAGLAGGNCSASLYYTYG